MIRLKDIALRAGVSVMTVSKVLRDAPDISVETKARIKLLASEMGYVPDSLAQGLRTGATRLLGLVISAVTNPMFARAMLAIEERAHEIGYDLVLAQTLNDPTREELVIRRLLSRRVDGLFISPVYRMSPKALIYEELANAKTPVVLMGQRCGFCAQFPNVETDDALASYNLTKHLLELGHKKIAYFSGPATAPWSQERLDGYRRALREADNDCDDTLVFQAGTSIEDGEKAALQFLNEGAKATAVAATNDMVAIGAATVFLNQGMKIPADLSVAGFGNILLSEHFRVPLTTVRQPKFRLGAAAMEMMQKLLRHESVEPRRLPTELLVRQSTGAPRSIPGGTAT